MCEDGCAAGHDGDCCAGVEVRGAQVAFGAGVIVEVADAVHFDHSEIIGFVRIL